MGAGIGPFKRRPVTRTSCKRRFLPIWPVQCASDDTNATGHPQSVCFWNVRSQPHPLGNWIAILNILQPNSFLASGQNLCSLRRRCLLLVDGKASSDREESPDVNNSGLMQCSLVALEPCGHPVQRSASGSRRLMSICPNILAAEIICGCLSKIPRR